MEVSPKSLQLSLPLDLFEVEVGPCPHGLRGCPGQPRFSVRGKVESANSDQPISQSESRFF